MDAQSKGRRTAKIILIVIGVIVALYTLIGLALIGTRMVGVPVMGASSSQSVVAEDGMSAEYERVEYQKMMDLDTRGEAAPERKIQREADLTISVESVSAAMDSASEMARRLGGYVSSSSIRNAGAGADIALRVPESRMDEALGHLAGLGRVLHQTTHELDQTEQYRDVEARLRNLRATEERLIAILGRTGEIADVLATEKEISRVRGEIEQLEAQVRHLDSLTSLATISARFNPEQTEPEPGAPTISESPSLFAKAFVSSIKQLNVITAGLVVLVGAVLPYLLVLTVVIGLPLFWVIRRKQARGPSDTETVSEKNRLEDPADQ